MSIESEQGQDDCDNYGCQLALAIKKYNTAAKNYQDLAKDFMLAESIRDGINMDIIRVQFLVDLQRLCYTNVCHIVNFCTQTFKMRGFPLPYIDMSVFLNVNILYLLLAINHCLKPNCTSKNI